MAQAPTVALPKQIPFVIEPANRGASTAYDARLVNCYMEKHGQEVHIYERFGLLQQSRPPAGNAAGRGCFQWLGDIYAVFGTTLYKNGSNIGTVDGTNGVYKFWSSQGIPKLQLGNGVKAYNYDAASGLVQITDVDFPTSFVKGWGYINGTTYVGQAGNSAAIQGSDIDDTTAWDELNVLLAQIEPDYNRAIGTQLVNVVDLKQWTGEIFYDAGNATGSPLGRVEGAKFNWGCLSSDGVRDVDGALMWAGSARNGNPEVLILNGLKAQAISTPPVERLLQNGDFSSVFSWALKQDGHRFYCITLKNTNLSLVYDIDENNWWQITDTNGNYFPIVDSCVDSAGKTILQHETNGRLYYASSSYALDDTDLIQVDIYTPNFDGGTRRRKQLNVLKIIADQQVGSTLGVRFNDNDFSPTSWTNFRPFDLSQRDPMLPTWGSFVRRAHNLRHRCPVRMPRLMAMEPQIDLGTL